LELKLPQQRQPRQLQAFLRSKRLKESIIRVTLESKTAITFKKAKKFHKINILIESAEMVTFSKEFKVLEIKTDQNDVSFLEIQCLQDSPGFEFFVVKYYKANNIKWVI
jgi:hypothetical protein